MIYETHTHFDDKAFNDDREDAIRGALAAGVGRFVNIGASMDSSRASVELAHKYPEFLAAVGVHPEECKDLTEDDMALLKEYTKDGNVVAIGEIGLDYHWYKEQKDRDNQKVWFIRQIELANKLGLPCSIHAREATGDTYQLLKEHPIHASAVLHCYSGSSEMLREFAKLGYYFGFDGPVTFKNAKEPKECALVCPLDRLLVETDSPYMSPTPFRGTTNEPKNIPIIVEQIATIREMNVEDLKGAIEENFERLFHVKP